MSMSSISVLSVNHVEKLFLVDFGHVQVLFPAPRRPCVWLVKSAPILTLVSEDPVSPCDAPLHVASVGT
jgi:hypothetical protein